MYYRRVSVLRGRVVDVYGAPLIGVRVSVITQPLYGFTLSRRPHAQYVHYLYRVLHTNTCTPFLSYSRLQNSLLENVNSYLQSE